LLPYSFSIRQGDQLPPEIFDRDGYSIKVYPPYQAATSIVALSDRAVPVSDVIGNLHPAAPVLIDHGITIDGQPTIFANAVQIDVLKPDFDRRATTATQPGADDPPAEMLFSVVNTLIHRLRSVGRSCPIHPITQDGSCWRIEFLQDSGEPLQPEQGKMRARNGAAFSERIAGLTQPMWQAAVALPRDFRTKAWEALLLDAEALLPDVVPALVLTAAALETLIGSSLAALAPREQVSSELWKFINNRGDYRKEPSVSEQFDQMLQALTRHSLKDRPELWEAFRNLFAARNSLMHDGILAIGGRPVARDQAYALMGRAKEIADWVEALLPAAARRPEGIPGIQIGIARPLIVNRNEPTD
jgi:hypothetical protein